MLKPQKLALSQLCLMRIDEWYIIASSFDALCPHVLVCVELFLVGHNVLITVGASQGFLDLGKENRGGLLKVERHVTGTVADKVLAHGPRGGHDSDHHAREPRADTLRCLKPGKQPGAFCFHMVLGQRCFGSGHPPCFIEIKNRPMNLMHTEKTLGTRYKE